MITGNSGENMMEMASFNNGPLSCSFTAEQCGANPAALHGNPAHNEWRRRIILFSGRKGDF